MRKTHPNSFTRQKKFFKIIFMQDIKDGLVHILLSGLVLVFKPIWVKIKGENYLEDIE